jgi:hypothetical protein
MELCLCSANIFIAWCLGTGTALPLPLYERNVTIQWGTLLPSTLEFWVQISRRGLAILYLRFTLVSLRPPPDHDHFLNTVSYLLPTNHSTIQRSIVRATGSIVK